MLLTPLLVLSAAYVTSLRSDAATLLAQGDNWLPVYNTLFELGDAGEHKTVRDTIEASLAVAAVRSAGGNPALMSALLVPWIRACREAGPCNRAVVAAALEELVDGAPSEQHVAGALGSLCHLWDDEGDYDRAFLYCLRAGTAVRARVDDWQVQKTLLLMRVLSDNSPFLGLPSVPAPSPGEAPRPVFIVGMPRSGTTVLEQMVSMLPGVEPIGEAQTLDWAVLDDLTAAAARKWDVPHPLQVYSRLFEPGRAEGYAAALRRALVSNITSLATPAVVIDKTVTNFMYVPLLARLLPDAVFLHCQRDPRDVMLSIFLRTFETWDGKMAYTHIPAEIGAYHREYARVMDTVLADPVAARALVPVRYEDVVADPEGTLRPVLARLGLQWDPVVLRFHESTRVPDTASNDQVRHPLSAKGVAKWKKYEKFLGMFS